MKLNKIFINITVKLIFSFINICLQLFTYLILLKYGFTFVRLFKKIHIDLGLQIFIHYSFYLFVFLSIIGLIFIESKKILKVSHLFLVSTSQFLVFSLIYIFTSNLDSFLIYPYKLPFIFISIYIGFSSIVLTFNLLNNIMLKIIKWVDTKIGFNVPSI